MPSRFITILILLFWASSTGWFFHAEFWPRFRGGEPPLFTIDLADEARRQSPAINWDILRDGKTIGRVSTSIRYRDDDDSFELTGTVHELELGKGNALQVSRMTNAYRVTREGKLLSISTEAALRVGMGVELKVYLDGAVVGNAFRSKLTLESPLGNRTIDLAPVAMTSQGSALNPLHPVDRIHGLSLGRSWRIAIVDPVHDALANLVPGGQTGVSYVQARVLPEYGKLTWEDKEERCFVIEYSGENVEARTWVLARDGTVLRQEARFHDEELILVRTP
jgi:hypothetical protein